MKITFLGHACLQIETAGKSIIVDPFISGNEWAKSIEINSLKADYLLITHAHQDHILDVENILKNNPEAMIISNFEIVDYYGQKGHAHAHPMNTGGAVSFDFGKIKSTIAHHSSVFPDGTYGGNPNGYVIQSEGKTIYIAGDTSLTYDMKLIPETIAVPDLAVLPIGDNFTMGVEDALIASTFLHCDKVLGYHYDTFGYIKIDHDAAQKTFAEHDKKLILLEIGKSIEV